MPPSPRKERKGRAAGGEGRREEVVNFRANLTVADFAPSLLFSHGVQRSGVKCSVAPPSFPLLLLFLGPSQECVTLSSFSLSSSRFSPSLSILNMHEGKGEEEDPIVCVTRFVWFALG